jgi:solute carrier family 25 carnitine/acylcarnitine transporter 20/29
MTSDTFGSFYKNFAHGSLAGMAGIVVSHPFDTIKTNYQEGRRLNFGNIGIVRQLYKGVLSPFFGVGLEKSVVFGVYYSTLPYTNSDVLSGALSGMAASVVVTPFERIKILLQTGQNLSGFKYRTLFQGLSATFTRETPGFALYFSIYNYLKGDNSISSLRSFSYGALAGTGAWIFIYPQDRIKTHMQAAKTRKLGFLESMKEIKNSNQIRNYKRNNIGNFIGIVRTFYKGFHLALIRAIPLHATAFMTVELCKKYL